MPQIDKQRALMALGVTAAVLHILYDAMMGYPIDCLPPFVPLPVPGIIQPTPTWWEGTPTPFVLD